MQDTPQQPEEVDTGRNQARAWHLHGGPLESTTLQSDADYQSSGTTHEDFADYQSSDYWKGSMQVRRHGRIYAAPPQVRMIPTTSQRSALLSKSRSGVERCYANDERCHAEGQLSITSGYDLLSAWTAVEIWALTIGVVKCFNSGLV